MKSVELDTRKLEILLKAFKNIPSVRVGVLGSKDARKDEKDTNAEIGARHEYGSDGMPVRSFLRVPIADNLQGYLDKSGAFDEEALKKVVSEKTLTSFMKKVGLVAETIVADAFDSGGFGRWTASNMEHKKVQMTLVESQQLRNSISSEVEE